MRKLFIFTFATSMLLFSMVAWAASTKDEVVALREQVEAMQKDLAEIKKLLQEGARAPAADNQPGFKEQVISIGDSPFIGNVDAPVTLVEYSDYQCPFCARHSMNVMPTLKEDYIDTGKVKFVMRENPIDSIHKNAVNAAMAGLCAHDQGKYWEMHDLMFANQRELGVDNLKGFAESLGLDKGEFDQCLDDKRYFKRVNDDIVSGVELGVRGTPSFFVGLTDPDDPSKADMKAFIRGAQSLAIFQAEIDKLLASAEE